MGERIKWIDIAKAIGISFVVLGHLKNPENINTFVYTFHMPLFFFLSGLTFKDGQLFKDYLTKKIRTLLIPYFLYAILTYFVWLVIGRYFGEDAKISISLIKPVIGIFYSNGIDNWLIFNTPLWYLTCLFIVEIAFFFISKATLSVQIIILVISGVVGYLLSLTDFIRLPWGINVALTAVVIYGIGNISKQQIHKIQAMKPLNVLISILFFTFTYLISRVNGRIDMNSNSYGNIVLFYCGAVMGIIAVITLSQWITKNSILTYIGQNTLVILALHGLIGTLIKGFMVFVFHIDLNILNDNTILNVIFTVMTLIIAVPIILFINRYLPELAGKKRLTTAST